MHKNSKETKERSSQWTLQALQFDFYYILTVMIEIKLSFFWATFCSWVQNKQTTTKTEAAGFFHRLTMIEMTKSSHCCVKIVEVSHSETKEEKMEYVSHYVSCRFSPAIFLFLVSIIPSIWILEIHHQQNKLTEAKVHISHKWRLELE